MNRLYPAHGCRQLTDHIFLDDVRIKKNLISQLTAPVRWIQSVQNMVKDGALSFVECGPGKVLQGLVKKIAPQTEAGSL